MVYRYILEISICFIWPGKTVAVNRVYMQRHEKHIQKAAMHNYFAGVLLYTRNLAKWEVSTEENRNIGEHRVNIRKFS
jgi:hypothetical protein